MKGQKKVFKVPYVNVQPYSGNLAHLAVYFSVCQPGDTVVGQSLLDDGCLAHGLETELTSRFFDTIQYHVKPNGEIDFEEMEKIILEHKPKLVWIGGTIYPREFPFKRIAAIAGKVGAYVAADIAHISGLVASGVHTSPVPYVHIITTTCHETLRGPRGGMIMLTHLGLKKDPALAQKIDNAVFPQLQRGPYNHQTMAVAVSLGEALTPEFVDMNVQIVKSARYLAERLREKGFDLVSGGTENHLVFINVGKGRGLFVQRALEEAGIILNRNITPNDPVNDLVPSGVRLTTSTITMRGMKEQEMKKIADWIKEVTELVKDFRFQENKELRIEQWRQFIQFVESTEDLKRIKKEVESLCLKFPIYHFSKQEKASLPKQLLKFFKK